MHWMKDPTGPATVLGERSDWFAYEPAEQYLSTRVRVTAGRGEVARRLRGIAAVQSRRFREFVIEHDEFSDGSYRVATLVPKPPETSLADLMAAARPGSWSIQNVAQVLWQVARAMDDLHLHSSELGAVREADIFVACAHGWPEVRLTATHSVHLGGGPRESLRDLGYLAGRMTPLIVTGTLPPWWGAIIFQLTDISQRANGITISRAFQMLDAIWRPPGQSPIERDAYTLGA
jgi:hypothetical protein